MSILQALADRKSAPTIPKPQAPPSEGLEGLSTADFSKEALEILTVLENKPRVTLFKMVQSADYGQEFVFYTSLGYGRAYVNAMRVLLSRTKNKMRQSQRKIMEFKLLCLSVHKEKNMDRVTVMRVKPGAGSRVLTINSELEKLLELTP